MAFIKSLDLKKVHKKRRLRLKFSRFPFRRGLQILPNLFTLGNAFFGFCSIILSAQGNFVVAAYFILLGAVMDALDGRVARFAHVTSELGMQLDSLCDAISFGLAPALLVYLWKLKNLGSIGFLVCAFFMMAGILRLARFNVTHNLQTIPFMGAPITIAGCFLSVTIMNAQQILFGYHHTILLSIFVLVLALLMISKVPFPSFKKINKNIITIGAIGSLGLGLTIGFTRLFLLFFVGYFLLTFVKLSYSYLAE